VEEVEVKRANAHSHWVWGAVTTTGSAFHNLKLLWESRHREDEYLGYLLNAYVAAGNIVRSTCAGETYMDVGTLDGYHQALNYLRMRKPQLEENVRAA
jgi:glucose-1-phosphate thymidylyltransferase